MPGGTSYNQNGSSLSQRLATQWQQTTGRPTTDPEYATWVQQAMPAMIAADRGDYERSKARWRVADRIAMGVTLGVLGAGVGSAIAGGGASAPVGTAGTASGGGGGSLGAIEGGSPWAVTPYAANAATAAGTGSALGGTGAGAAGGAGAGANFLGISPSDWASIGLTGASTIGAATQGTPNMNPTTQTTDPNLQKLISTMQGRLDQSEPLYKSIMSMANGLLPTKYQNGGAGR